MTTLDSLSQALRGGADGTSESAAPEAVRGKLVQAVFCVGERKVTLRQVPDPEPQEGEVLVQVHSCGICGSDLHCYLGEFPPPLECMGHEISGTVARTGKNVERFTRGDRVVIEPIITCGSCRHCETGDSQRCRRLRLLGTTAPGGFADFVAAPQETLYPIPDSLDLHLAALTEPTAVAIHALRLAELKLGEQVLVLGAGSIGLLCVLAAKKAGAKVAVTARHEHQRSLSTLLGADAVFDPEESQAVAAYSEERGIDLVIETVGGRADTLPQALDYVRPGGQVVALGVFTKSLSINPFQFILKEAQLKASVFYSRAGHRPDFSLAIDLLTQDASLARRLVTHTIPLGDAEQAFALAADKRKGTIKVLVQAGSN